MMQAMRTTAVPLMTAFWLGHSTFLSSPRDSWMKWIGPEPGNVALVGARRLAGGLRVAVRVTILAIFIVKRQGTTLIV